MSWEQPGVISREECSLVPPTLMHCLDFSSWAWIMKEERWGTGFTMHLLNSFLFAFVFVLSEAQPQDSQGCTLSHVWQGPRVLCETYLGLWVTQTGWRIRWWGEREKNGKHDTDHGRDTDTVLATSGDGVVCVLCYTQTFRQRSGPLRALPPNAWLQIIPQSLISCVFRDKLPNSLHLHCPMKQEWNSTDWQGELYWYITRKAFSIRS